MQSIRRHKFCRNFKEISQVEFTRDIELYSSRGINNNCNNCYVNASFQEILGSSVFDLLPLKREQETDIKTRLLNLHEARTIENSPLDFEFHLHGSKVINCSELTNDILDNFNYENKEMMDAEKFVLSLLQKIFSEEGKLHTFRLKYLDLKRCAGCSSSKENVGESSILRLNLWNCTNQMEVSLFSMLYNYFICDTSKNAYEVCKENCERKFYQSAKLLLNLPAILIINTYRAISNVRGKINKTPVRAPNVLDISPFLAFKKGDDGISKQYQLASAINYRGSYLNSGHYVRFICDDECYMIEFNDTRVSLPEIRFENTRSKKDTHALFYIREDKIDVLLQKDAIPPLEVSKLRTINDILLGQKAMINTLIKQSDIKACINDKLNDKIINHFFKYLERQENIVTLSSFFYSSIERNSYNSVIAKVLMDENFFNNELVLIPINQCEHHWLLVAVLLRCKKVVIYDSLDYNAYIQICENFSKFLSNYSEIHTCDYLTSGWSFSFALDILKQKNNIDCGVYTCIYAPVLAKRLQSVAVTSLLTARYYIAMMALEITPEEYNSSKLPLDNAFEINKQ